jgi:hypothetical protein
MLEGSDVRLEPLSRAHEPLLWDVAKDHLEEIFRWIPYSMRTNRNQYGSKILDAATCL